MYLLHAEIYSLSFLLAVKIIFFHDVNLTH